MPEIREGAGHVPLANSKASPSDPGKWRRLGMKKFTATLPSAEQVAGGLFETFLVCRVGKVDGQGGPDRR